MANLIGKNILIVDEVDDTRTTLEYAVRELMKDVEEARKSAGKTGDESETKFSIFVLHVGCDDRRFRTGTDLVSRIRIKSSEVIFLAS